MTCIARRLELQTLGEFLRSRQLDAAIAIRNTLHPDDISSDFGDIAGVETAGALAMYDRMQDGAVIADSQKVLSFIALADGQARLTGYRTFTLRARGNVPGDIVYHYDAAPLLHSFIARAKAPTFYDALDADGLEHEVGRLIVRWPQPLTRHIRDASDSGLLVIAPC